MVTLTTHKDVRSYPCRSMESAIKLAADYVRVKAPLSVHPLRLEYQVNPLADDFAPIFENGGTLDVACGPFLFDLKNKERDYTAQMAAYGLDMFQEQGWNEIEVHLWFCDTRRPQVFKLTEESAQAVVDAIVAAVRGGDKAPTPCDYCAWCARRLNCPALLKPASTIARERDELSAQIKATFDTWVGAGAHTSQIQDPALMGAVLKVARVLADWCEAAEFRAKELAIKEGKVPRGFKLQSRKGNRFISSVTAAFPLVGLPQADFLKACELKPSALFETYAAFHGLKKAPAERDVEAKLAGVIQRKPSTQSLVAEKKNNPVPWIEHTSKERPNMPVFNDSDSITALLPEGDYVFCVAGLECKISNGEKTHGFDQFRLELRIEPTNKPVYETLADHPSCSWKIDTLLKSAGVRLV